MLRDRLARVVRLDLAAAHLMGLLGRCVDRIAETRAHERARERDAQTGPSAQPTARTPAKRAVHSTRPSSRRATDSASARASTSPASAHDADGAKRWSSLRSAPLVTVTTTLGATAMKRSVASSPASARAHQ
nr:hypothetical protein [Burkholderia pseudomallei]